jgi:PB1 domain
MIFKIALGKQIHLINSQDKLKLQQILTFIPTIFKNLPRRYALTYLDEDGDEITLKEQDDYDVLLSSGLKTARILIRENFEEIVDLTNEFVI